MCEIERKFFAWQLNKVWRHHFLHIWISS